MLMAVRVNFRTKRSVCQELKREIGIFAIIFRDFNIPLFNIDGTNKQLFNRDRNSVNRTVNQLDLNRHL